MWISTAFAQEGAAPAAGDPLGGLGMFLPLILIFVVFYFLLIRPQQKKMKAHRAMVAAVRRGDKVLTQGGVFGTVTKVISDTETMVEIAEGVRIRVLKSSISDVLNRTDASAAEAASSSGGEQKSGGILSRAKKSNG